MFSFKGFITKGTNTHLEHLEDDIINNGTRGGRNAVNFLKSLKKMLSSNVGGKLNVTVKWDGAPAIICGKNPENGKFFVGTKSVFNKNPKINYSTGDIRKNHSGDLANKLSICLRELSKLRMNTILQGDLLFTSTDLKRTSIDGEDMFTFTPNTITYAVPKNSGLGKKIARARLGIVFHTMYSGKDMKSLNASFGRFTGLPRTSSIFITDATYKDSSGSVTFNRAESAQVDSMIRMAEGSLSKAKPVLDKFITNDALSVGYRLKTFFNYYIKNTQGDMGRVKDMITQFETYYENMLKAEIDKVSREQTKDKYRTILKNGQDFINKHRQSIYFAVASYITLQKAKNFLIRKLNQIQSVGHFIRTADGYRVTAPEGYVAVDRVAGAVKLVDRLEFSRANFTIAKDWVKG
tara:strand:+ start:792 stop:2012 length:1221 start_codon:yes stop_codon:yes gene_type:complete